MCCIFGLSFTITVHFHMSVGAEQEAQEERDRLELENQRFLMHTFDADEDDADDYSRRQQRGIGTGVGAGGVQVQEDIAGKESAESNEHSSYTSGIVENTDKRLKTILEVCSHARNNMQMDIEGGGSGKCGIDTGSGGKWGAADVSWARKGVRERAQSSREGSGNIDGGVEDSGKEGGGREEGVGGGPYENESMQVGAEERKVGWHRRSVLASSPVIIAGLVNLLYDNDLSGRLAACNAITGLCQNHVENATMLGGTRGLLEGLRHALCSEHDVSFPLASGEEVAGTTQDVAGAASHTLTQTATQFPADIQFNDGNDAAPAPTPFTFAEPEDTDEFVDEGFEVTDVKEAACQALVHLAIQNHKNKVAIVKCAGVLDALRALLSDSTRVDSQDTAAMVIANCADNFAAGGGAEAARIIVSTRGILSALCTLVRESSASFTDSADRSAGLAAVISLSDHRAVLDQLRAAGALEALNLMLQSDRVGKEYDSMRAEALMAVSNLSQDLPRLEGDPKVLETVVQLSHSSVLGKRGEGTPIWAVRECLRPLVRLTVNTKNRRYLAGSDHLLRVLANFLKCRTGRGTVSVAVDEEVVLAVIALSRLMECDSEISEGAERGGGEGGKEGARLKVSQHGKISGSEGCSGIFVPQAHAQVEDGVQGGGVCAHTCLESLPPTTVAAKLMQMRGVHAALAAVATAAVPAPVWQHVWGRFTGAKCGDVDWHLSIHTPRHVAVCMGFHSRLGRASCLRVLDVALLYMILQNTCSFPQTAASMLATFDRRKAESFRRALGIVPASLVGRL